MIMKNENKVRLQLYNESLSLLGLGIRVKRPCLIVGERFEREMHLKNYKDIIPEIRNQIKIASNYDFISRVGHSL